MQFSRRDFIGGGMMATVGMTAPGCFSMPEVGPASAPVSILRPAGFRKPGDKIRMAFIGSGGRGGANLGEFLKLGEEIVALCDVDRTRLDGAAKRVAKNYPKVHTYQDWRDLLEREKSLDAVVVSTPDHMHAACAIAAMERGCHVYLEKPLVRTWWEAERFREVAKKCGVVTQMGNNGNAQGLNRPSGADTVPETLDWNLWLGVAPKRPYKANVYHAFKWRGWFDFGTGAMGDIACHAMSFFWRGLDLRDVVSVETVKSTQTFAETYPKATTVKVVVTSGRQSKPVEIYWYDGKTCPPPETCRRLTNGKLDKFVGTFIAGEEGVFWGGQVMLKGESKFTRHQDHPATKGIPVSLPRVQGHHWEFAEAVRGGARPLSDWDHSVPLTEMVLLGCISQRVPGRLDWDAKAGRFRNSDAANALLTPYVRPTWTIG